MLMRPSLRNGVFLASLAVLGTGPALRAATPTKTFINSSEKDWKIYTVTATSTPVIKRTKDEAGKWTFKDSSGKKVGFLGKGGTAFTLVKGTTYTIDCEPAGLIKDSYHQFAIQDDRGLWKDYIINKNTGNPVLGSYSGGSKKTVGRSFDGLRGSPLKSSGDTLSIYLDSFYAD